MLFSIAGCRLFIGESRPDQHFMLGAVEPPSMSSDNWVQIGSAESMGMAGVQWETATFRPDDSEPQRGFVMKTGTNSMPSEIILGADPDDAGQALLWTAAMGVLDYAFRLDFPGESGAQRFWIASVTEINETFDEANAVIRLRALLQSNSELRREGGP